MKVFFDCEMTGLFTDSELISIGLVDENGRNFYAEFNDCDFHKASKWVEDNVIKNLYRHTDVDKTTYIPNYYYGNHNCIAEMLENWFRAYDSVELVSDVCHYDMSLFCNMFGGDFYIPKIVAPACYDINQDIMRHYNISMKEAFDMSREDILYQNHKGIMGLKHNSLYDARVIREIYYILHPEEEK